MYNSNNFLEANVMNKIMITFSQKRMILLLRLQVMHVILNIIFSGIIINTYCNPYE